MAWSKNTPYFSGITFQSGSWNVYQNHVNSSILKNSFDIELCIIGSNWQEY